MQARAMLVQNFTHGQLILALFHDKRLGGTRCVNYRHREHQLRWGEGVQHKMRSDGSKHERP
jgi:hypothetical protein